MFKSLLALFLSLNFFSLFQSAKEYDVVVYGETLSGVSASIQAARMGKKVVLISQNSHVGGTATSGLTATDMNRNTLVGGIAREFYQNIYAYYQNPSAWRVQSRDSFFVLSRKRTYTGKNDDLKMQWVYESHVAEKILFDMLKEAGVEVALHQRLDETKKVKKKGKKLVAIQMETGEVYKGRVFIDATYEGDLMAKAGVSYFMGRESNQVHNETLSGIKVSEVIGKNGVSIDPYVVPGNPSSGLLPFVDKQVWGRNGDQDKRVQAYTYRVTLTNDPANRIPITKPENFNPLWFEVMVRRILMNPEMRLQSIITLTPMPNKKTDTNHLDFFGASYDYPEGDYKTREAIARRHRDYAVGMLWVLGNDERLPEHIRKEMKEWGWPKDEFRDTGNFPYQLYVREARRMVGDFVMTEQHVRKENRVHAPNSIGLGTYAMDCHHVSRVVDQEGKLRDEGTIFLPTTPYTISYEAITPKKKDCTNLLVPVCLSASHVAYTTIRMEPVYMILGQSAGAAAALAIDNHAAVQALPYEQLRQVLVRDKQIISLDTDKIAKK